LDEPASVAVVRAALDNGITHFDTAESYGDGASETFLGRALGRDRDRVTIATKFGGSDLTGVRVDPPASPDNVRRSCELSLRRLGVDHIDLYYLHWPDPLTPVEATLAALDDLVSAGWVRAVGVSNHDGAQLLAAAQAGTDLFASSGIAAHQFEWSLLRREAERSIVPASAAAGLGVVPYFPLASGLLTGKYTREAEFPAGSRLAAWPHVAGWITSSTFEMLDRLLALAAEFGKSLLELALGWLIARQEVATVLVGATAPAQVVANVRAASSELTPAALGRISALTAPAGS
jgi:aryl-alcohol dehydrogenase-like predicted oxidoreductase